MRMEKSNEGKRAANGGKERERARETPTYVELRRADCFTAGMGTGGMPGTRGGMTAAGMISGTAALVLAEAAVAGVAAASEAAGATWPEAAIFSTSSSSFGLVHTVSLVVVLW
jgi:hypothetical protein